MNFHRPWTIFALDAEHDAYGMARIAQAHNTCMSELASARAERDIACTALCPHGLDIAAKYENAKRELAAARALLLEARGRIWHTCGSITAGECLAHRIDAAIAGEKK